MAGPIPRPRPRPLPRPAPRPLVAGGDGFCPSEFIGDILEGREECPGRSNWFPRGKTDTPECCLCRPPPGIGGPCCKVAGELLLAIGASLYKSSMVNPMPIDEFSPVVNNVTISIMN